MFGSKVPNCKDLKIENLEIPGPGEYEPYDKNGLMNK